MKNLLAFAFFLAIQNFAVAQISADSLMTLAEQEYTSANYAYLDSIANTPAIVIASKNLTEARSNLANLLVAYATPEYEIQDAKNAVEDAQKVYDHLVATTPSIVAAKVRLRTAMNNIRKVAQQ